MNQNTTTEAPATSDNQAKLPQTKQDKKKGRSSGVIKLICIYGFSIAMLHSFVKSIIYFRRDAAKLNIRVREYKDLLYVLLSAICCVALRYGFELLFKQGIVDRIKAQGITNPESRIEKCLKQGKDIMYYGIVSVRPPS